MVTRFTPWDQVLEDQVSTSSDLDLHRAQRLALPRLPAALQPAGERGQRRQHRGSVLALHASRRAATTATRNRPRSRSTRRPASSRRCAGSPTAPSRRSRAFWPAPTAGARSRPLRSVRPSSRLGFIKAGAGPGSRPIYVGGDVYLAGPYRGAPLSLLVVIPAVSGPYDLGNVVTRVAVYVDPATAQITTVSDPLPRILDGVPLRARYLQVGLDRPDFTLNPTRCDPFSVGIQVIGDEGALADRASPFPGRQLLGDGLLALSQPVADRRPRNAGPPGHPRALQGPARRMRTPAVSRSPCRMASSSTTRTSARSAGGANSPTDSCPANSLVGHAVVIDAAARRAARREASTCAPPRTSFPIW